ncbi:hypothetical protein WG66_014231 [Moniliophthora roreri]|nr:hypothetical protein WG66_014231 [Moniliophthora roreri]
MSRIGLTVPKNLEQSPEKVSESNHSSKLKETAQGRCHAWSNTFPHNTLTAQKARAHSLFSALLGVQDVHSFRARSGPDEVECSHLAGATERVTRQTLTRGSARHVFLLRAPASHIVPGIFKG